MADEATNKSDTPDIEQRLVKVLRGEVELRDALEVEEPFVESVEQTAYSLYASGRYYTAETLLKGLVSLDESREYPHLLLGDIALRTDRMEMAKRHFALAFQIDESNPVTTLKLGETLIREGNSDEARQLLEMTVELADEDNPHVQRAGALLAHHAANAASSAAVE